MKVIALLGIENTGKSHTINLVYSLLLVKGYNQVSGYFENLGDPKFEDFFDVLIKEDIKVGFVAMGDYERGKSKLSNYIAKLEHLSCDFVICACRDKDGIKNEVKKFETHVFISKIISKGAEENRIINVKDAIKMIEKIK
jgi:hypothetical protein